MADKLAIVTGASTGIGFELAHLAAKNGYDVLIVANEPLIESAGADLHQYGVEVNSVEADLSTFDGVDRLLAAANGRHVDILCANAGHGLGHGFLDQAPAEWRHVIDTNITGTLYLLQKVLKEMVARNEGKVLITGSIAGFIPGAFQAVYNGSKAFVDSFADAIRNELKESDGVQITTLMPGPVETEFFHTGGMDDTSVGASDSKSDPAVAHVTPAAVLAEQHRKMAEPGSDKA